MTDQTSLTNFIRPRHMTVTATSCSVTSRRRCTWSTMRPKRMTSKPSARNQRCSLFEVSQSLFISDYELF